MGTRTCLKAFAGSAPWPGTFCPGSLRLLSTALGSQPKHLIKMASPGPVHKIGGPHPTSSKHFSPTNTMLVATVSPPPERLLREQAPLTAPSPAWRRPPREPGHLPAPLCRALPHATGPLHHRHRNGGHVASPVRGSTHISASKHQRDWLIGSNTRNWGRRARRRGPMAGGGGPSAAAPGRKARAQPRPHKPSAPGLRQIPLTPPAERRAQGDVLFKTQSNPYGSAARSAGSSQAGTEPHPPGDVSKSLIICQTCAWQDLH